MTDTLTWQINEDNDLLIEDENGAVVLDAKRKFAWEIHVAPGYAYEAAKRSVHAVLVALVDAHNGA